MKAEQFKVEETAYELTHLSDRIDLAVNYLSCLDVLLAKGAPNLVTCSLVLEKGADNLIENLKTVSEDLVKVANSLEESK